MCFFGKKERGSSEGLLLQGQLKQGGRESRCERQRDNMEGIGKNRKRTNVLGCTYTFWSVYVIILVTVGAVSFIYMI